MEWQWGLVLVGFLVLVGCFVWLSKKIDALAKGNGTAQAEQMQAALQHLEQLQREEFARSRQELGGQLEQMRQSLDALRQATAEQLKADAALARKEQAEALAAQRKQLNDQLELLQQGNERKLEQIRKTVDEQLQTTLERRLTESFKAVSENLNRVQQGLGEMKTLASDVGGLKKVLSNVKTRGILGEVQLERILEQMLHPGQYDKNIATKAGSGDRVEFAIRLPGQEGEGAVWLPVDAKFPTESYQRLQDALEAGNKEAVDSERQALRMQLEGCAKYVHEKYVDPPNTTDFAILFLPTEGLYAEAVREPMLFEKLQQKYKVTLTGPSTLAAFLNALQMGFKTLALQQHSAEIWQILGAIKTEFGKFAAALASTQTKIRAAENELEKLVGTRTNAMARKLREVELLPEAEAQELLA